MGAGTIQGTFGWDNSPLISGMNDAEKIVSRGAANAQSKFSQIFKRSPNMRAERAISGALQSFAAGDIAGGIENITQRMTGLGLVAGVAIGAGVAIFVKFREQIIETRKAHEALQMEMTKRPVSNVVGLNEQGMDQALAARQKLASDLQEKSQHRFGSELAETFQSLLNAPGANFASSAGKERLGVEQDLNKVGAENKQIMQSRAELARKLVELKAQEAFGDDHAARISRIVLETEQARAELKEKGLTHAAFDVADKAAVAQGGIALALENKREESKKRSLDLEEKMARLTKDGLKPEDQRKVRTGLEIKNLDQQISEETDPTRKRELNLQKRQKQNELVAMTGPGTENQFAFGTIASRNFESDQGGFGTIAQRSKETQDAGAFGTLANSAMLRGESQLVKQNGSDNAEVVRAIQELKTAVTEALR